MSEDRYKEYEPFVDMNSVETNAPFNNKYKIKEGDTVYYYIYSLLPFKVERISEKSATISRYTSNGKKGKSGVSFIVYADIINKRLFLSINDFKITMRKNIKKVIDKKEKEVKELRTLLEGTYND